MFKPTISLCSALSKRTKRVKVQILRDFPRLRLFKGEVKDVKPSLMINYLHYENGARYIHKDSDIDNELLAESSKRIKDFTAAEKELEKQMKLKSQADLTMLKQVLTPKEEGKKAEVEKPSVKSSAIDSSVGTDTVKIPGL
ncbi:HER188Cp [Eremothecium sinecaudum]|uniref:HER188Cp n=1 Tax=Eremothecium sinecaudum TaxID=45286 RepID=A0A109UXJ6_9SACH|nr:HER188Cp [Eremothecium sinecaudum]AMD21467.1 HER188Cp [Eremothecium sinecaudum]